jgi:hypothetical protein
MSNQNESYCSLNNINNTWQSGTSSAMRSKHAQQNINAVCKHATRMFIRIETYMLPDVLSPLFHLLHTVLTSSHKPFLQQLANFLLNLLCMIFNCLPNLCELLIVLLHSAIQHATHSTTVQYHITHYRMKQPPVPYNKVLHQISTFWIPYKTLHWFKFLHNMLLNKQVS